MASERVLIVDDQAPVRAVTSAVLKEAGYSPVVAGDSVEAVRYFSVAPFFDLVILNIRSPEQDGLALLDSLRAIQPEIPVVVVSAIDNLRTAIAAIKKGAFDYLIKPVGSRELLATIDCALQSREAGRRSALEREMLEREGEARTELLSRVIADLERSYDITLEALGNALDLKDAETEGHSKRVTAYSIVLARALHIDAAEVKVIARGAFLHDIGKMAIPDAILSKPGKLTAEERAVMREHCVRGYTMLRKIPFLEKVAEIVFSHQEHYDGSGYSRGLKGEEIPLGARIFSVADTLDAITSDRPYRRARSFADARREIERCSGTQFDPAIVSVYQGLPDRLWEELRVEINQPRRIVAAAISETLPNR